MAEEEIGKINRKLQKMIDKNEVVGEILFENSFSLIFFVLKTRMNQLHEIYLVDCKTRV